MTEEVRTAIGQRTIAEDITIAERIAEGHRTLVISPRTALIPRATRAVASAFQILQRQTESWLRWARNAQKGHNH